ncbi:MAG: ATP-binding protein [Pseudomonadota bacterium]
MIEPEDATASGGIQLPPFSFVVQSGQLAVREALGKFFDQLGPLNLGAEEKGTVELVLAEALNNIVEHAYPEPNQSGPICVDCAHESGGLVVDIKDQGRAMPDGKLPLGQLSSLDVELEDLPEGGFGWFLIQHLAKDVSYVRVGSENHLRMRLAIGSFRPA